MRFSFKRRLLNFGALLLVCALFFLFWSMQVVKLSALDGERTFYFHSASSQGLRKKTLALCDYPFVKGESVCFSLDEGAEEDVLKSILQTYDASVLLTEEVGDVRSYYCYTARWQDTLTIEGEAVNLHVAFGKGRCTVGTPIIFDGF